MRTTASAERAMMTVSPANTTADPAVATARPADSSPRASDDELVAVARDDEQGVVDADREAQHQCEGYRL